MSLSMAAVMGGLSLTASVSAWNLVVCPVQELPFTGAFQSTDHNMHLLNMILNM
jgi:hypothetical protein